MKCKVTFCRPYDRTPGDHLYGKEFDDELTKVIGGKELWSHSLEDRSNNPKGKLTPKNIDVVLHEGGPEFTFLIDHASEINAYIASLTSLAALWIAVRADRRAVQTENEKEFNKCITYTKVEIDQHIITSPKDLTSEQISNISNKLADFVETTEIEEKAEAEKTAETVD